MTKEELPWWWNRRDLLDFAELLFVEVTVVGFMELFQERSLNCGWTECVEANPVLAKVHLLLWQTNDVTSDIIVISEFLKRYLKAKRTRAPAYSQALSLFTGAGIGLQLYPGVPFYDQTQSTTIRTWYQTYLLSSYLLDIVKPLNHLQSNNSMYLWLILFLLYTDSQLK